MGEQNKPREQLERELADAQRRLEELEYRDRDHQRLQAIIESTTDMVSMAEPSGDILYINPAGRRILGLDPDEDVTTLEIEDLHPLAAVEKLLDIGIPEAIAQGTYSHETEILHQRRRTPIPVSQVIIAHPFVEGEVEYLSTVIRDISESHSTAEALRVSEARFRSIVDASPMGVHLYRLEPDDRLIFEAGNPAADRLLGIDHSQLVGKTIEEAFPPLESTELPKRYREAARDGLLWESQQVDYEDDRIRGAFQVVAFQTSPDRVTVQFLDITDRLREQQERQRFEAQLQHQQKLESIGTLAAGVAHEINNPLNGILNYAQLISNRLPSDHPTQRFAHRIVDESERVATIVRNLLAFARQDKQSHSPADLLDIISSTLSLVRTVLRKDQIEITVEVPDSLPSLKCRSQQIQQVLMNLFTNARDALNARFPDYDERKEIRLVVEPFTREGQQWLRTTVHDRGAGIPQELTERIFDPFFTTKPRALGTGLGLTISYGIIMDHHGELVIESVPGEGTSVHMELPVDNGWSLEEER